MKISVNKIKPHPLNAKIYGDITEASISNLAKSIGELGLLTPLTLNKDHYCISGHQRLKIIASMPARRPSTSKGYATAAERINKGTLSNAKKKSTAPLSVIVEEKEGKVKARKLAPRKLK